MSDEDLKETSTPSEASATDETSHALDAAPKQARNTFSIALISVGVLAVLALVVWALTANRTSSDPVTTANDVNTSSQATTIPAQPANDAAQTPPAEAPAVTSEPPFIEPVEALDLYNAKNVTIVDVRAHEAYMESHVKDSVSIPEAETAARMSEFPKEGNLVLYCTWGGDAAAARVAQTLQKNGYTNMKVLRGGFAGWRSVNGPIEDQATPTLSNVIP